MRIPWEVRKLTLRVLQNQGLAPPVHLQQKEKTKSEKETGKTAMQNENEEGMKDIVLRGRMKFAAYICRENVQR